MGNPEGLEIVSTTWPEYKLCDFLKSLEKDSVFGISDAYEPEVFIDKAAVYGVKIRVLPKKDPLRKKYGSYVFKVVATRATTIVKRIVVSFDEILYMEVETAKRNRKCYGSRCTTKVVSAGVPCLVIRKKITFSDCRQGLKKESYCTECGKRIVEGKIVGLRDLHKKLKFK